MAARLALFAAVLLARAPAGPAPLTLVDPLSCPSLAQLRRALNRDAPRLTGALSLSPGALGEVQVTWKIGERSFTRHLRVRAGGCAAGAETVALLAGAWERSLPTEATGGAPPPHSSPAPPAPARLPTPVPATVAAPAPPRAVPVIRAVPPAPPEASVPWHLSAGGEVRGLWGVDPSRAMAAGALAAELGRGPRWAVQLDVGLDTPSAASRGPGSVHVQRQTLALRGHVRFHPWATHPSMALRVALGPMLERLAGTGEGYSSDRQVTVYQPGLAADMALELGLGRLTLAIGPQVELSLRQAQFQIDGVGTVLTEPWAWVGLAAGGQIHFF